MADEPVFKSKDWTKPKVIQRRRTLERIPAVKRKDRVAHLSKIDGDWLATFDGSCQTNPGNASCGWAIYRRESGLFILEWQGGAYVGFGTNNFAEFKGLIEVLTALRHHQVGIGKHIAIAGDSQLVIRGMQGRYKIKAPGLVPLLNEAQQLALILRSDGRELNFHWVQRALNHDADRQAYEALQGAII